MSTLRAVELIKTAAENITGFAFITGTRLLNNIEADDKRLPLVMLVRPLSIPVTIARGGRLRDSYQCLVIFANKSELEYQFELHEPIVGDMRLAADQFFVNLNSFSDYVQSITSITYADYINDFDANLTGIAATFTIELVPLDEQVCPTGVFVPEDLPPFTKFLTDAPSDGNQYARQDATWQVVEGGGGGGGGTPLRTQDDGVNISTNTNTLNFTGNVQATLASTGNVTVNVPTPTPQVNSDWNASSGVAEILNKPSIPAAQVNSDWNASSGVSEILNKPTIPAAQIQSDWNQTNNAALDFIKNKPTIPSTSGFVPYTGATQDVNLGVNGLTVHDLTVSHPSGSGVAASITKGGSGEALTVVKSSGSGNAASITGGVTLISELHLTTDLADSYIASAATWNAKQAALTAGTGISLASNVVTNTAPDQTVVLNAGSGILVSGTYPNFTIQNSLPSTPVFKSATNGTATSGTANTVSSTQLVAGGSVTPNSVVRIIGRTIATGTSNTKTTRIYVNDTPDLSGSPILLATFISAASALFMGYKRDLLIKSATETEFILASISTLFSDETQTAGARSTANIDWSTNKYIVFANQCANAGDSAFISGYTIQIL